MSDINLLSTEEKERIFHTWLPMARGQAGRFAQRFNLQYDELEPIAVEALAMAASSPGGFDRSKARESTWAHLCIYYELLTYCTRRRKPEHLFSERAEEIRDVPAHRRSFLEHLWQELGEDARIIVDTIISAPADIAEDLKPARRARARQAIKTHLAQTYGWTGARIAQAWKEVAECL